MHSPRRPWRRRVLDHLVGDLDFVVPVGRVVVLHSAPDLDDSTVALLRECPPDVRVAVLVEEPSVARERAHRLGLDVDLVPRRSLRGLLAYLRAPVTVTTHGMMGCGRRRRGRQVVGLWHGEFGKRIGTFVGEGPRHFDWVPVSSELSRQLRSAEFALDPAYIHVVGAPRHVLLSAGSANRALTGLSGPQVVVAPTYRRAVRGMRRVDGDLAQLDARSPWTWPQMIELLERYDATLWLRPHPSGEQELPQNPRVRLARNSDLEELGLTFYELLGAADCLVTDYSSIWVDYLRLDRPILGFCPDLEAYRDSRGLALEPYEQWFPGVLVADGRDLLAELEQVLAGRDHHASRRAGTRALLVGTGTVDPVGETWRSISAALGRTRR